MDLNFFDAIIISLSIALAIKGYYTGIIKELAGLIGIGAGLYLASFYYKNVGEYINSSIFKIPNESAINVVGFVAVFIITWIIIVLIGFILSKILQVAKLGILDSIGGVIFSAGKFFVLVSVIITMLSQIEVFNSHFDSYKKGSIVWPIMQKVGNTLIHLKPEDVKEAIETTKDKINETVGENVTQHIEELKQSIEKKGE